ncbi:MAG TPA: hypothetical protein VK054_12825 [Beutenbergiaceae bacterium]|nr:hypothetical protein [Beutenbergiaceae bacterium]
MENFDDRHPTDQETKSPPLAAFAQRHRLPLAIGVAVIMLGVLAWSLATLPSQSPPGFFGIVHRYTFPVMATLIATVSLLWGLRVKRVWINLVGYLTIATYVVYLITGWVYERFLPG